jgi:NAD(P)-dependent dehydrogenase (short-subunit alcohol dehydrogenase family)
MLGSPIDLTGRVAVVVGGTSGIGRAIAHGLAASGADVVPSGRRRPQIDEVAAEIEACGRRTLRCAVDVSDVESLQRLLEAVLETFGRVDILVNSAGQIKRVPTLAMSPGEWFGILDVNLSGTLRACQIFGRQMIEQRYGRIINIASLSALVALYEVTAYSVSKAGVVALTRSLAIEWARHGVCVNAIAPGVFRTALNATLLDGTRRGEELLLRTPMGRFGRLEETSGAAVFLASEAASFTTGQVIAVDGGFLASGVNQ